MRKKDSLPAFTIIEILIVIAIIGITLLAISSFDFSRLSQAEKLDIETIKAISLIEEIRNNALIGKGVGIDLDNPQSWTIDISQTSSGSINGYYTLEDTSTGQYLSWDSSFPFSIKEIQCLRHDESSESISTPLSLTFSGDDIELIGCSDNSFKNLSFTYGFGNFETNVTINSVTGVIETN